MISPEPDFTIDRLGECAIPSPMRASRFRNDDERLLYHSRIDEIRPFLDAGTEPPALELAGPRQRIFFDPAAIACGIVTCGGLCPGINDVIRSVVLSLRHHYGAHLVSFAVTENLANYDNTPDIALLLGYAYRPQ